LHIDLTLPVAAAAVYLLVPEAPAAAFDREEPAFRRTERDLRRFTLLATGAAVRKLRFITPETGEHARA